MSKLIGLFLLIPILVLSIYCAVLSITFDQNCEGYLKRAADANSVELATSQMKLALSYIESSDLTSGYTSVVYRTPDEDIGFWYTNLKSSLADLEKVTPQTTPLERTNILMKLRETLLDHASDGTKVTFPQGISRYPHNGLISASLVIFGFIGLIGFLLLTDRN